VEAVIVSTPHHLHVPIGLEAAKRGKHVLMEKPIATCTRDARKLIAACKRRRLKLGVLYPFRFTGSAIKAAELIRKGVLGRVTGFSVICMRTKAASYWRGGYSGRVSTTWRRGRETSGGGFLIMNFSHDIDMVHSLLKLEPRTVYAQYDTFNTRVEVEDYISVVVRYRNGVIGTFLGSTVSPGTFMPPDQIYGTKGTIALGDPVKVFTEKKVRGLKTGEWNEISTPKTDSRTKVIEEFARAVRGEGRLTVTGESALSSLKVVEGAYTSQDLGRPVTFR
jgi:predicted dehydrogenase